MKKLLPLSMILFGLVLNACGAAPNASETKASTTAFYDEYDPISSTYVYHWKIEDVFQFNSMPEHGSVRIQNVDVVHESMRIYIGSCSCKRHYLFFLSSIG